MTDVPQSVGESSGHLIQYDPVRDVPDRQLRAPEHQSLVLEHLGPTVDGDDAQEVRLVLK